MKSFSSSMLAVLMTCGLASLTMTSCNNSDNPVTVLDNGKRYVLAEVTESYDDGTLKQFFYSYDKEGRMTSEHRLQSFTDGQSSSDDVTNYSYDDGVITEQTVGAKKDTKLHLNADGLLVDWEYYNFSVDEYLHTTYEYDDAQRLTVVHEVGMDSEILTWDGDDLVKITDSKGGEVVYTVTIEPSAVASPGFFLLDMLGSIKQTYLTMGLYGKLPKHLPATMTLASNTALGSSLTKHSFTYTVTDGLLTECIDQEDVDIDFGIFQQKKSFAVKYVFVWKEL
jgi:hypothetical protein